MASLGIRPQSRAIAKSREQTQKRTTRPRQNTVYAEDIKLYFRCENGVLKRFEGATKVSDLVEKGLW